MDRPRSPSSRGRRRGEATPPRTPSTIDDADVVDEPAATRHGSDGDDTAGRAGEPGRWPGAAPSSPCRSGRASSTGRTCPLGTDTIIAAELAERLADASPGIVVAPPLAISASGEHAGFPGTLSIGTDVTAAVLVELARSADWAAGIVLVNGHGGNADAVERAVATIRAEGRNVLAWWPRVPGGDAHAGRTETSLMLAIEPDLVDVRAPRLGSCGRWPRSPPSCAPAGVGGVSPTGVLGDPTDATLEHGRDLLDILTDDLVAAVDEARSILVMEPTRNPSASRRDDRQRRRTGAPLPARRLDADRRRRRRGVKRPCSAARRCACSASPTAGRRAFDEIAAGDRSRRRGSPSGCSTPGRSTRSARIPTTRAPPLHRRATSRSSCRPTRRRRPASTDCSATASTRPA